MTRSRNRSRLTGKDPVERVPFRLYSNFTVTSVVFATATVNTISVTPAMEARLAAIADVYQYYRFTELSVSLTPHIDNVSAGDVATSVGYLPRIPDTAPTNHVQIQAMPASAYKGMGQTMPAKMRVPRNVLLGDSPLAWYQSVAGTQDAQWETQGQIFIGGTASQNPSTAVFYVEGVCEFKGRSFATQTPLKPLMVSNKFKPTTSDSPREVVIGGESFKIVKA